MFKLLKNTRLLRNAGDHYCGYKNPPRVPVLSQFSGVFNLVPYLSYIHFKIIQSTPRCSERFPTVRLSELYQGLFLNCPSVRPTCPLSDTLRFDHRVTVWWTLQTVEEPGSSGSIVSDYGLGDRMIGVRSRAGITDFSSNLSVQIGSEAHLTSCTMGTEVPFPGAKRGRGLTLTTHPHLVPSSRMSRSYTSSPPKRHHGV
jgi:hypothetical protein